eukprot:353120-Chlamydomonas_euryale.AAC.1
MSAWNLGSCRFPADAGSGAPGGRCDLGGSGTTGGASGRPPASAPPPSADASRPHCNAASSTERSSGRGSTTYLGVQVGERQADEKRLGGSNSLAEGAIVWAWYENGENLAEGAKVGGVCQTFGRFNQLSRGCNSVGVRAHHQGEWGRGAGRDGRKI